MLSEPETVEQHGMAEGYVRLGVSDYLSPDECARQLGDGDIGTALRDEFDHFVEALRTAVKARLDTEPGRNVTGERGIEAGELAVRSNIVERRLVSLGHGHNQFAAVEDSLDIRSPQIGGCRRYGADSESRIGRRRWRGAYHSSPKSHSED